MSIEEDQRQLKEIEIHVRQWLREHRVPSTMRNIIYALIVLNYMDWLDGDEVYPESTPETRAKALVRWLKGLLVSSS